MPEDVSYRHSDLQRIKEIGGWIVGGIVLVVGAFGFFYDMKAQQERYEERASDRIGRLEADVSALSRQRAEDSRETSRQFSTIANELSAVRGATDAILGLLQGGVSESGRPTSASQR